MASLKYCETTRLFIFSNFNILTALGTPLVPCSDLTVWQYLVTFYVVFFFYVGLERRDCSVKKAYSVIKYRWKASADFLQLDIDIDWPVVPGVTPQVSCAFLHEHMKQQSCA